MYIVAAYLTYLAITVAVTVWVGLALRRNGRVFLVDAFHGDAELADSVIRLLGVGFYVVNFGLVALSLLSGAAPQDLRQAAALVYDKAGAALAVLSIVYFLNLYLLTRLRRLSHDPPERRFSRRPQTVPIGRVLD